MKYKKCKTCNKEYPETLEFFIAEKRNKSGVSSICRVCRREWEREYKQRDYVKIKNKKIKKEWDNKNIKHRKEYMLKWHKENKEHEDKYRRKYRNNRYNNDIEFRIKHNLSTRIRNALKGLNKSKSTIKLIGCGIKELKLYLESQFKYGMTWENYGKWQIDHKLPCDYFDLTKQEEQYKCFNYKNLQPLWAKENRNKSNKIIENYIGI